MPFFVTPIDNIRHPTRHLSARSSYVALNIGVFLRAGAGMHLANHSSRVIGPRHSPSTFSFRGRHGNAMQWPLADTRTALIIFPVELQRMAPKKPHWSN